MFDIYLVNFIFDYLIYLHENCIKKYCGKKGVIRGGGIILALPWVMHPYKKMKFKTEGKISKKEGTFFLKRGEMLKFGGKKQDW